MNTITLLIVAGLIATVITLVQGVASMAHGGASDQARSHLLMFRRVGLQAVTVAILLIILLNQVMAT
jgi:hypothetical protein